MTRRSFTRGPAGPISPVGPGQQGVTDHGALTGLADDDHPQYTSAAEALAPVTAHEADTTGVHGIADTAVLATAASVTAAVAAHETDTTTVHGIADTSALATTAAMTSAIGVHAAAADPHTGYQKETEKDVPAGYAGLDGSGLVPDARIAATIARDSEVTAAVDARLSAANALDLTDGGPTTLHTHPGGGTAVPDGIPPAGALGQTYPRGTGSGNFGVLSSGRLQLVGIWLPTGTTVTNVVFMSGTTAAGTPTNQWFGLFDQNRVCLRLTSNATTAAWAANTAKSLALTATFVTTYTGLHYLGVMVTATTVPTLTGAGVTAQMNALVPIAHGNSNTGLTTPPGLPFTANALTGAANVPWGYVT